MSDYELWRCDQIIKSEKYPFTAGQLRHFLLYRKKNGLAKCVRKIGKGLVIRMDLFDQWIEEQIED